MAGNEHSGNPNAAENGTRTQFGQPDGADPVAAQKLAEEAKAALDAEELAEREAAKSLRRSTKFYADKPVALEDADEKIGEWALMGRILKSKDRARFSPSQLQAARAHAKAILGDMTAMNFVGEQTDGRVPQVNFTADLDKDDAAAADLSAAKSALLRGLVSQPAAGAEGAAVKPADPGADKGTGL